MVRSWIDEPTPPLRVSTAVAPSGAVSTVLFSPAPMISTEPVPSYLNPKLD